jgi:hypothetical protein
VYLVAIPPALARAREVTTLLEVGHDPRDGPLGDPHPMCHLAEAHLGLFCDAEQHLGVVAQECPPGTVCRVLLYIQTTMRRLLTSVGSEAINFTTWISCVVCPEFGVPSHVEIVYKVASSGLRPASRGIREAIW